ncbi:hypothetical protein CAOG_009454 [Capsaspora owczarzaki ATCC 30864]|uniref:LIM zinc-binding domain-containing protein n=1 Tax=Capsaspora owczarzaki (strain ATCC 30864) TaxID=595528 RepID=A0A0D2VK18_CAPO3|nr:hypothetical protein CAOG_009454 [Capsaspora owczarzaki ATCC 30864]
MSKALPCVTCGKTAYPLESFCIRNNNWHKTCFQCSICSTKLTLNTYKLPFEGATLYCAKCLPQDRPTITTDNVDFVNARERPKIGVVNEQVRGELAGQKPNESVDSLAIANRVNAPKAGLVNDQVRGELAGVKPNESTDSLAISNRVNAPRQEVVNQQLRYKNGSNRDSIADEGGASPIASASALPPVSGASSPSSASPTPSAEPLSSSSSSGSPPCPATSPAAYAPCTSLPALAAFQQQPGAGLAPPAGMPVPPQGMPPCQSCPRGAGQAARQRAAANRWAGRPQDDSSARSRHARHVPASRFASPRHARHSRHSRHSWHAQQPIRIRSPTTPSHVCANGQRHKNNQSSGHVARASNVGDGPIHCQRCPTQLGQDGLLHHPFRLLPRAHNVCHGLASRLQSRALRQHWPQSPVRTPSGPWPAAPTKPPAAKVSSRRTAQPPHD